jgi:hypothetical protein
LFPIGSEALSGGRFPGDPLNVRASNPDIGKLPIAEAAELAQAHVAPPPCAEH